MESQRVLADRYALISHLARGGMADVYVAEDRRLGRQVAVKILHNEYASNESFIERFRREAQAAATLSDTGIVAVHDWGEDDGTYFMVMELIQGRNLRDIVRTEGALLPRRVAEIGVAVASALSAAHAQGLVHRDIKPANILLTPNGSVKVADFGIARAFDDSEQLTRTGAVIGTATYFSPEQAQGYGADSRSDIYSLGVVLYELLTGRAPFSGDSSVAVAYQHVEKDPTPPSELNPKVPRSLETVVLKAMAKDPEQRYQTADDLGRDLGRLLAGQVPVAAAEDAPTRVMTAAGAGGGAAKPPPPPAAGAAEAQTEPSYEEPGRLDRNTIVIGALAAAFVLGLGILLLIRLLGPGGSGIEIPDVRGETVPVARATLEGLGFIVDEDTVPDDEIPIGRVAGTDPPAGQRLERGDLVTLLVSDGPADIPVPDVIDRRLEDAEALIRAAGLEVGTIRFEASDTVADNTVIDQDPSAGVLVTANSTVDLVVAAGPDALEVPDVANRSEADALFALSTAGFGAGQIVIERRPSGTVLEGFVIETIPGPGQIVPSSGTVTVVVSLGAVPTVVPDVIGLTPEDARTRLEEFEFEVVSGSPVEIAWNDPNAGRIAQQSPEAGQILEFGGRVTIHEGRPATQGPAPDVVGDTEATARQKIEGDGFEFATGDATPLAPGSPNIGRVVSQSPTAGTVRPIGSTITVSMGVEGAVVPDLFTGGAGACTMAVSRQVAQNRITAAQLTMTTQPPVDEYFLRWDADNGQFDPGTFPQCEGRTVSQSPPPNTVVAKGTAVQVTFDRVLAPAAADIFGRLVEDVINAYRAGTTHPPAVDLQPGQTGNGKCQHPTLPEGTIGQIDPMPGTAISPADGPWVLRYWLVEPGAPACQQ